MRKIFQYILMAVAVVATASCNNEMDEPMQSTHHGTLQFVVSDFSAFGEDPDTRASQKGTPDEGKTAWEEGDELIVSITFENGKKESISLEYKESVWTPNGKIIVRSAITEAIAVYAPGCEIDQDGNIGLKDGKLFGQEEYIPASTTVEGNTVTVTFNNVDRTYSRLRMAGFAGQTYTVTTTGFTPAGATSEATEAYTLTADDKGNAYLYGTFAKDATVTVKQGDFSFADYTFTEATKATYGYALEARPVVGGTLSDRTTATEEDITALVEEIKSFVDNGITTIVVTGSKPAIIDMESYTNTAIGEAIYRLSGSDNYDENNPYNGKIDLILPNVTEIVEQEFYSAWALNSITLPKVTIIGDMAFQGCDHLTKLTFGSVLTTIDEHGGFMFGVGDKVGGCDLLLNCGQMNSQYVPNLATNTWTIFYTYEFKSITLTHTGECDECKTL